MPTQSDDIVRIIRGYNKPELQGKSFAFIIFDDISHIPDSILDINPKSKCWESKIPHHNPYNRGFSSPSNKARAKARLKRKRK